MSTARRVAFAIGIVLGLHTPAKAHDIYNRLYEKGEPNGRLCCGGDPVTGDCEGIANYEVLPNGDALFVTQRYGGKTVRIGKEKIGWMMIPGGEAFEAHWCGVPRTKVYLAPVQDDNPDTEFWTYCAFIAPGGV